MVSQLGRAAPFLAFACLIISTDPAFAQDDADGDVVLYDYVVKKGDTCLGIAIRELGDRKAYKKIHIYNKLGPLPHNLKPGQILRLPKPGPTGPDANLSAQRGSVAVREPAAADWAKAILGQDLFRKWRVSSRKRSTAEITFRDTSRLRMRENTVVIIYGPSSGKARRRTSRATLERGTLRSRLAELDGKEPSVIVETPSSDAELGPGSAIVDVDDSETARVSNHRGKPARVRSRRGKKRRRGRAVAVAPGMGSKVQKDAEPTKPKPLPPSPAWRTGPDSFTGWSHLGVTLRGTWDAVDKAAAYRVEIARDSAGDDIVASVVAPAPATAFEANGFPDGEYYVSVASIDADKFESAPSPWRKLRAQAIGLIPFGADAALPARVLGADEVVDVSAAPEEPTVLPGSRVVVSNDLMCVIGTATDGELTLKSSGRNELRCRDGDKESTIGVNVASVQATLGGAATSGSRTLIPRERPVVLKVAIAANHSIDTSKLTVTLSAGMTLVERRDAESSIELVVRASRGAPNVGGVVVTFGPGGPSLVTKSLGIEARPAPARPPTVREPRRRTWEVGALVGGNLVDDEFQLGNSPVADGVLEGGWLVGARAGYHFTPSFSIELEGTYQEPDFVALRDFANVLAYRAHGLLHLRDGKVRPFVLGGVGGTLLNTDSTIAQNDTDKEVHWGLGARWVRDSRASVRLELRHRVSSGRVGTFSNIFEAALGISWML